VVVYANQPTLLSRFSHWLGWTGFIFCALALIGMYGRFHTYFDTTGGLTERYVSGDKFGKDKVVVLTISGVIMDGDGFVKRQIDRIREDDNAKAVVVRVESPGGTVTGSDYIFHHLKRLREEKKIPLVVSMGSIAASGGYYVSMAVGDEARTIYAEPTTTTGSIGVMMPHYDVSGLMEKLNVKDDTIATHERKTMLSMTKPLAGENRAVVQATIDQMFDRFKSVIKEGRPVFNKDPAALDQLATGEVFLAEKAKMHGLVDEIGFIEDAIDRALELAHLSKESTRVVKYRKPESLVDILEGTAARAPGMDLGAILDLSTPRAYYLFSSFPAAVSTARGE
jgi:protease-4